jgi:hypothetical protein
MRLPRRPAVLAVLLALAAAGCGGSSGGTPSSSPADTNPVASAPDAKPPPPDATQPGTGPVTTPAQSAPQTTPRPSNGGGEQQVRVPATFTVVAGRLEPPTITVPPFLAVEVTVLAADGRAHRLTVRTPAPHTLTVAAGGRAAVRIPGLRAGSYAVELDGHRAGAIVAGGDAGP